jgi:hypothetical protein
MKRPRLEPLDDLVLRAQLAAQRDERVVGGGEAVERRSVAPLTTARFRSCSMRRISCLTVASVSAACLLSAATTMETITTAAA